MTMYYYIISALDQDTACRITDVLRHPPATDKYKCTSDESFWPQRKQISGQTAAYDGLGYRIPSQLMSEMLVLLDRHEPCFLFWQIFLEQMPTDIRLLLWNASFKDLQQFATHADYYGCR
ncbi:hypothetical protein T11_15375 [Trichinella zimbabwensis]|uniref:Uncharacterized protein n=1 Tax=Trichinella zimbabwensis TaxID=268475 RepID=A0A0V1HHM8_9BILA|nr:hypothetical protein T11_15375 [Trichinella zimbabwensis]